MVTLQTAGVSESLPDDLPNREQAIGRMQANTMLGRSAPFEDVGNVAAFAA